MKVKQIIAMIVVVALLMTGSVLVTMAYLTDTKTVTNVFTVGNIRMNLDEAKVDKNGVPQKDDQGNVIRESLKNEYHLVPGGSYTKDPTVTIVENSDDCYVRMMVTVSNYDGLKAAFPYSQYPEFYQVIPAADGEGEPTYWFLLEGLTPDWNSNAWECKGFARGEGTTATYEFRYIGSKAVDGVVKNSEDAIKLEPLFETVKIPMNIKNEALANIAGLQIDVAAHAIQADGFMDANAAWLAFAAEMGTSNPDNG